LVWAGTQAFGQPRQRVDLLADVGNSVATVAGQLLDRPPLGGLPQPRLADTGERQPSGMAENSQVPDILGRSSSGLARTRRASRIIALSSDLAGLPETRSTSQSSIEPTCPRRSVSQTARRLTSLTLAPPRTRCWIPNSTSITTSGASPRRLTCPPSETADWVSRQCRSSAAGSAVTVLRHRDGHRQPRCTGPAPTAAGPRDQPGIAPLSSPQSVGSVGTALGTTRCAAPAVHPGTCAGIPQPRIRSGGPAGAVVPRRR
jgi:hypothetical protein